jgi:hypothetical protein
VTVRLPIRCSSGPRAGKSRTTERAS